MMRANRSILTAAVLSSLATIGFGQTRHLLHVENLEGVYTQDWHAVYLGPRNGLGHEVYVSGNGKRGDFTGVLHVDCTHPEFSQWRAQGGYLTSSDVPPAAILAVRQLACAGGQTSQ